MSLTIKAYLQKMTAGEQKIRRFSVPADVSSSYDYISRKISDTFSSLRHGKFSLFWKDPENDLIAISSDEELLEALGYVEDSLFKIYIRENQASTSSGSCDRVHPGVICDECNGSIVGIRYKCLTCPDYDLCSTCEQRGLHLEHNMMKISTPLTRPTGFWDARRSFFDSPLHFHHWMHQFMRCMLSRDNPTCYNQNETCCGQNEARKKDDKTEIPVYEEQGERETNIEGEDPMTAIGEGITAMLDLFEHHGRCSGYGNRGLRGRGGCHGRGRSCKGLFPRFGTRSGCREKCRQQQADDEPKPSTSGDSRDETINVQTEHSPCPSVMKQEKNSKSSGQRDNGWILLTNGRECTTSFNHNNQMTPDPEPDSDGDLVALSTNEELFDALGFVKDNILKIYVREKASNVGSEDAKAQLHPGLKCDGCNEDIIGSLFMCMECPDYDLCSNCEKIGIHKEHDMVRLTSPMETECCAESLAGHPNLEFPSKSHEPEHGNSSLLLKLEKFKRRWISRNCPGRSTENVTKETKIQNVEKPKNLEIEEQKEGGANVEVNVKHAVKKIDESSMWNLVNIDVITYVDSEGSYVLSSDNGSSENLVGAKSMETEPPSSPMKISHS